MQKAYMNWSGGKDSALCLYEVLREGQYGVRALLTSVNTVHDRISMHGVRRSLLEAQAAAIGLPLTTIELPRQPGMTEYESRMREKVESLQQQGFTHALFGDIFLEDLRAYREEQLAKQDVECVFPLWGRHTTTLLSGFMEVGFKAIIVCVNEKMLDKSFCGRLIDESFLADLPAGVDPCGENGEYHSFVFDGPIFRQPVAFEKGEIVRRTYTAPKDEENCFTNEAPPDYGFYFQDLLLKSRG